MEQLGSHWAGFHWIWCLSIFRQYFEKIQVSFKFDKNNGALNEGHCTFMIISRSFFLRMRYVWEQICTENQNTYFMFRNIFRKFCLFLDNVERYVRDRQATVGNVILRMRFACWINKATNIQSVICNTNSFSTATTVRRTSLNIMFIRPLPVLIFSPLPCLERLWDPSNLLFSR